MGTHSSRTDDHAGWLDPEALQSKLAQLLPSETGIKVAAAADSLVLSGVVSDTTKVDHALSLANAYVRRQQTTGAAGASSNYGMASLMPDSRAGSSGQNLRVINLLSVAAPQQVMIEVKVAEVSKSLTDKLGASFSANGSRGAWNYGLSSSFPANGAALISAIKDGHASLNIDAERDNGLIKILAEPNVMAISGQEGSFLAGGKVYIPVPQSSGGTAGTTITLQEKDFGIGVKFTPTVLADGLINLKIAPEVSEFSREGLAVAAAGVSQPSILPVITTRRAATTVQLFDGQSFVIGGLIKNNVTTNINALPMLGEIPILGALFRSSAFVADRSEVLFVVTPRLVKPISGAQVSLPTDKYIEPSRVDVFMGGRLEGDPPAQPPQVPPQTSKTDTPTGFVIH